MTKNKTFPLNYSLACARSDSQVMTKNKTFPLNYSLACASYGSHLAIHSYICKEGRKNRKNNDEKGG